LIAAEYRVNRHVFTLPDGFEVVSVAGPPLVERPINAAFDEQGFLYVTDSSGSNDPVQQQVKERPHRIVRLEDSDDDGRFDKSVVYADKLMFPEGAMWYAGSLYVAAPPEIWKFTDVDGDGIAEHREVWFDGGTLTNCANDLHGPYLGHDGWIYWCKGAYAEQTYERPGKTPFVTSCSHIFRRHPDGQVVESVMTGGMANPVDVVFTPGGERIFNTTFLTKPQAGLRDGLIHAVYGGVYGQDRPQLREHPMTGPLMPVLDHLGAAAPSGLACLESDQLGTGYRYNLMTSLFNMHKVTRHILEINGATFSSDTSDFLVSDNRDFHPTDVIEDADGSLIVIDTGGWYKLCCPTSQLWKPDLLGGIYRVRRIDSQIAEDPRGLNIKWSSLSAADLVALLRDSRWAVRQRAAEAVPKIGNDAIQALKNLLTSSSDPTARTAAVWALTRIRDPQARMAVRSALEDQDATVRQAALHSISLLRDAESTPQLLDMLRSDSLHNRRAAAEALGRVGSGLHVPALMEAAKGINDRELEHSLIFAAIEIGDHNPLIEFVHRNDPPLQRTALIALDQMEMSPIRLSDVAPLLQSPDESLRQTAWWVLEQHPEWSADLAGPFREILKTDLAIDLIPRLSVFGGSPEVQQLFADLLDDRSLGGEIHEALWSAMGAVKLEELPAVWEPAVERELQSTSPGRLKLILGVLRLQNQGMQTANFGSALKQLAVNEELPDEIRLRAMTLIPKQQRQFDDSIVDSVAALLGSNRPVVIRSLAIDALQQMQLNPQQLSSLVSRIPQIGSMELRAVVKILVDSGDTVVAAAIVDALAHCPAVTSLRLDELQQQLAKFGEETLSQAQPVIDRIQRENGELLQKMDAILALASSGDIRNGQAVFHGTKAACSACHAAGYLGGTVGPGLTRIGKIRTERDLLEAILFPSASFVQGYEPVSVLTLDGQIYSGVVLGESDGRLELQVSADRVVAVDVDDIEQRSEGKISIMPAGLDKQLTIQELADLIAFLKSAN
jgi:putative membrane-bound dehydrogenase-like protein